MDRSRRLTFTVGTSLLTASLATGMVGCAKKQTVNVHPDEEPPHVNEGPVDEPDEPEPDDDAAPPDVEPPDVNVGPEAEPE
ncbi:MAG: hypothetical protein H6712_18725 [Myxococcales bacterium]|nr:hypothetical protein [Myxococcales bacterium]MCB9715909.1 hypothetical protein [Myxococcales bacterium]